jgi:hypothetical protein
MCHGQPRVLACGRLRPSCPAPLRWSSPAKPNEPEQHRNSNDFERNGRADRLALTVTWRERTRARNAIQMRSAAFPERTRALRQPNEPEPCASRTNPSRAPAERSRREPKPARKPNDPGAATNPNEPEPHTPRGAACQVSCRGDGFPGSHGPRERKVNGEWLMSGYRRPKSRQKQRFEDEPRTVTKPE